MTTQTQNPTKPFTGNFQLQTKIRVIIQEVLAATIRKLSVFNQKIDKFEDYFMVYKQKVQSVQKSCAQNHSAITVQHQQRQNSHKRFCNQIIKSEQTQQKNNIRFDQISNEVQELGKTIKLIHRQNQNLNSELSKTKGKFLEYSNVISALKEQVSWKITKYIQQTAQTNTEIKINNEQMKKEYFNIILMMQKQKQKYQKIIQMNENHENNLKKIKQNIFKLEEQNQIRIEQKKRILEKIDEYDTILQSKLKNLESKSEMRISELQKDNKKSMNAVKKLQVFNSQLEDIKEQIQRNNREIIKKIQEVNKKSKDQLQIEFVKLSKQLLKIQKALEKKLAELKQHTQKTEDFLSQKIDFIKIQMQNQISSHTNKLIQEKQNSSKVNSSTMDEINSKFNKFNLEIHKQIAKVQSTVKEIKFEIKKDIEDFKDTFQTKIQAIELKPRKNSEDQTSKKFSPQISRQIEDFSQKIKEIQEKICKKDQQIAEIKQNQCKTEIFQKQIIKKVDVYLKQQQQDISNKVQKIMFLVTKMRGDNIVRSEFVEKQIKQIKKSHAQYRNYTDNILKLMPAFGECINLILALIYDAEFQHSKIIQESLPLLKKDEQKFNTCLEGVLYEFKEKKKPGTICYRHKDIKKTQIVKATFNAYIKIWEELFQNDFKNKTQYLPKGFYKKAIQKSVNKVVGQKSEKKDHSISPNKENSFYEKLTSSVGFVKSFQYTSNRRQQTQKQQIQANQQASYNQSNALNQMASKQATKSLRKIQEQENIKQIKETINSKQSVGSGNDTNLNSFFHIRKKKTVKKDEVIVMNIRGPQ